MKLRVIAVFPDVSDVIAEFEGIDQAVDYVQDLIHPDNIDLYYIDLVASGGYIRIEDEHGNEWAEVE